MSCGTSPYRRISRTTAPARESSGKTATRPVQNNLLRLRARSFSPGTTAPRPYRVAWNFGDGTTGSGQDVTHDYAAEGTYTVTLVVTLDDGNSCRATTQAFVIF